MEQIVFATEADIPAILEIMNSAVEKDTARQDWYVTDDEAFVRRHITDEGYTLKYIIDNETVAFLVVRHPGEAEDNLGRYLPEVGQRRGLSAKKCHRAAGIPENITDLSCVAHMESAAVHLAHRGKGLQGKLLQYAAEIEQNRGTRFLMATVHPDNIYSLGNLERAGYKCILETEKYGGLRRKVMCRELG